jgi:hypothetical protein
MTVRVKKAVERINTNSSNQRDGNQLVSDISLLFEHQYKSTSGLLLKT